MMAAGEREGAGQAPGHSGSLSAAKLLAACGHCPAKQKSRPSSRAQRRNCRPANPNSVRTRSASARPAVPSRIPAPTRLSSAKLHFC